LAFEKIFQFCQQMAKIARRAAKFLMDGRIFWIARMSFSPFSKPWDCRPVFSACPVAAADVDVPAV
jgi:hypothetical protein